MDKSVRACASFDDGSGSALYAGGSFTTAGDVAALHIARWNGTSWSPVGTGFDNDVLCLTVWDDGNGPALYAGGKFTLAGAAPVNGIAKWNGSSWAPLGSGVADGTPNDVRALCAYDDGTGEGLFVGGRFSTAGGVSAKNIARWRNGTWASVGGGLTDANSSTDADVDSLAVYDDGTGSALFASGYFNKAGVVSAGGIARWNGVHWGALTPDTNIRANALVVWDDGVTGPALYIATNFGHGGGFDFEGIARWSGFWSPVGSGLGFPNAPNRTAYVLAVHDDGNGEALYVGGDFYYAGGLPARNLARWDGHSFTALSTTLAAPVRALCVYDDGAGEALCVGGDFTSVNGTVALRVARRAANGFTPIGVGNGISGYAQSFSVFDAGSGPRLIAGGGFVAAGNVLANNIAAFDGATWSPLGSGTGDPVAALAVFDEGHGAGPVLFAGGHFQGAGAVVTKFIARWDGSTWSSVSGGTNGDVNSLAVFDDGSGPALYASGSFNSAGGGVTTGSVARWNGSTWSSVGRPPVPGVDGITAFDDGSGAALYGYSNIYAPPNYFSIVYKFDGSNWVQVGATFNRFLLKLYVHPTAGQPTLYAGASGVGPDVLWRWNGVNWISLPGLDNGIYPVIVRAMATYDEGIGNAPSLIVAGAFSITGSEPAVNLARWDGAHWSAIDSSFPTPTVTAGAYGLGVFDDPVAGASALFVGGLFTSSLGAPSSGIAERVGCPGPITAYCFGDGSLTTACPCANFGAAGHGCANSSVAAGARLSGSGAPSLGADTLVLQQTDSLSHAFTIVLQGTVTVVGGAVFGDGLRCAGGSLKRLYTKSATAGTIVAPGPGDPSISARSAALGDPLAAGSVRHYQAYYRDPVLTFCPVPAGKAFNVGNAVRTVWGP